jgi:glycosyltransferase involved in cell wall biosynthesis
LGVVFPKVKKYLTEYLDSLQKQTYKDFDLIIINDGLKDFDRLTSRYKLNIIQLNHRNTPAKIREYGINFIKKKGYDFIVFSDSDDVLAADRIEKSIELLKSCDIVVNDVTLISNRSKILKRKYFSRRLRNGSRVGLDFIMDKNIFGFTNTAARINAIEKNVKIPKNPAAADWYLFSVLLNNGLSAVFTNKTVTYYRIYKDNIAGLGQKMDKSTVLSGLNIKFSHYKNLAKVNGRYKPLLMATESLKKNIDEKSGYVRRYIKHLTSINIKNPLWWEQIKLPQENNI